MTTERLTAEQRAELRRRATESARLVEHYNGWGAETFGPSEMLALLDALDDAEAENARLRDRVTELEAEATVIATWEGVVTYRYGDEDWCVCCPGKHVYSAGIEPNPLSLDYSVDSRDRQDLNAAVRRTTDGTRVRLTLAALEARDA